MFEFHISRHSREKYAFDQSIFSFDGNVIFANFHSARLFAQKINQRRDLLNYPENAIKAGQINALGLIDEILHFMIQVYKERMDKNAMANAAKLIEQDLGKKGFEQLLSTFIHEFPPTAVFRKELSANEYLNGKTKGISNKYLLLEELILLWITNQNPAAHQFAELLSDHALQNDKNYHRGVMLVRKFFESQPAFGSQHQDLMTFLRSPAVNVPHSLSGQLEYIRSHWGDLLGSFLYRLLGSLDMLKEEEKTAWSGAALGAGTIAIPTRGAGYFDAESEKFSPDRDWMPRLVMIAKNAFVWLNQLSKKYQREIITLNQIPDEELDTLANRGFTGLWLIGLWERSQASAKIKQLCGNPDAISSAYSLDAYQIAEKLGGHPAYENLKERAWNHGIRLASDMVPNHMGIDSDWVMNHPEWFLQLPYNPYPSHTFHGQNLSKNPDIGIYLEDHYYDHTDAAVEFKRVDHSSGDTRYIYHGNDGTSMPWNDTAQLDYLNPTVREQVIQTILEVARKFPIIRFDAAMTLTKKHYQRLWFPQPGSGGDIPTRAEHGMTKEQFDAAMPAEFWREVVDRCAAEAPDTLLLAEAFWLMEGYFVRTLGMHRVYNSAFMNMLRDENNAGYRKLIKNTLEFEPEILKRYVNFMNNPDERTAVEQFGKGDKYFGICILMSTLPGLPMFGHGQVEGYSEKYGMEFYKPLWDESEDLDLIKRHQKEVFPILHRRALFANMENFRLYDFSTDNGVNENVYAFTNQVDEQKALVMFNNSYPSTSGWIDTSAAYVDKSKRNKLVSKRLWDSLQLTRQPATFLIMRDSVTGFEFIQSVESICERGFFMRLNGYETHVFTDFRQIADDEWHSFQRITEYLDGQGVPRIEDAIKELVLAPVQKPFHELANAGFVNYLLGNLISPSSPLLPKPLLQEAKSKFHNMIAGIEHLLAIPLNDTPLEKSLLAKLELALSVRSLRTRFPYPESKKYRALSNKWSKFFVKERVETLIGWLFTHAWGELVNGSPSEMQSASWFDEWGFAKILRNLYLELGEDESQINNHLLTIRLLIGQQYWLQRSRQMPLQHMVKEWFQDEITQNFLGINRYQEVLWYNKERLAEFIQWVKVLAVFDRADSAQVSASLILERLFSSEKFLNDLENADKSSGYQVHQLISALGRTASSDCIPQP